MKEFIKGWSGVASLVLLVLLSLGVHAPHFGALTTNFTAVNVTDGYYVDDTQVIDGSGNWVGVISTTGAVSVGTFTQGGGVFATSSPASAPIPASYFDVENVIDVTPTIGAITLTSPASTTFPLSTTAGSSRQFFIFNATSTAAAAITIAGGTGVNLEIASSTLSAGLKAIQPGGLAVFTAYRAANSDIELFMNPGQ